VRVPSDVHRAQRWAISDIAHDFRLLDVWALPVEGGEDEFGTFLESMASFDPTHAGPLVSRALFWIRLRLGALLGWDDPSKRRSIPGSAERTLVTRLPEHLRGTGDGFALDSPLRKAAGGFTPLYRTDKEAAAEVSNDTVHGVLHLSWNTDDGIRYRAQMAIYVQPRGRLGEFYLALIKPFRYLIVYPALMREIERAWADQRRT
jgi:hypothetical protein